MTFAKDIYVPVKICDEWIGGGAVPIERFARNEDGHIGYYKWANVKTKPFFGITEEQKMDAHIAEYEVTDGE